MPAPIPVSKAIQLLDRLSEISRDNVKLSEFALASLRNDARASIKEDAIHGYTALGAVAALAWNDDELDAAHRKATALVTNPTQAGFAHANYATSLKHVQRRTEAAEEMYKASQAVPENITYLAAAAEQAIIAGMIDRATSLNQQLRLRSPGADLNFDVEAITRVIEATGAPEDELLLGQAILFDVLRANHTVNLSTRIQTDEDPGQECIIVTLVTEADYETAQRLHEEACARLCEELPDGGHPDVLMFGITGSPRDEQLPA